MENGKLFTILGWVATATAIGMYVSYIPQISDNLAGHKGNPIQPCGGDKLCFVGYLRIA